MGFFGFGSDDKDKVEKPVAAPAAAPAEGAAPAEEGAPAAEVALKEGGSFFGNFFGAIINTPIGIIKGAWKGLTGNPGGTLAVGGIFGGLNYFAPQVIDYAGSKLKIGDKSYAQSLADHKAKDGITGVAIESLKFAGVTMAGGGAVVGGFNAAMGAGENETPSTAAKVGGGLGATATIAGIVFLISKAMEKNDITVGHADNSTKTPLPAAKNQANPTVTPHK